MGGKDTLQVEHNHGGMWYGCRKNLAEILNLDWNQVCLSRPEMFEVSITGSEDHRVKLHMQGSSQLLDSDSVQCLKTSYPLTVSGGSSFWGQVYLDLNVMQW